MAEEYGVLGEVYKCYVVGVFAALVGMVECCRWCCFRNVVGG